MLFVPVLSALLMGGNLTSAQGQVTLRYMPPIGKTYRYQMTMDVKMASTAATPAMGMGLSMDISEKAVSRAGDISTVETSITNGKVNIPANSPMAMMKQLMEKQVATKTVTLKYSSRHENKGLSGSDASLNNLQSMIFPLKPIAVGSSWMTNVDLSKLTGGGMAGEMGGSAGGSIPVTYKLIGVTRSGGHAVARIHISMSGNMNVKAAGQGVKMHLSGTGDSQIDLATGVVIASKMSSVNNMSFGGMTMKQISTQAMTLK